MEGRFYTLYKSRRGGGRICVVGRLLWSAMSALIRVGMGGCCGASQARIYNIARSSGVPLDPLAASTTGMKECDPPAAGD